MPEALLSYVIRSSKYRGCGRHEVLIEVKPPSFCYTTVGDCKSLGIILPSQPAILQHLEVTMSETPETPQQRQIRIRQQKREAKLKAEGQERLNKITQLSGRKPETSELISGIQRPLAHVY